MKSKFVIKEAMADYKENELIFSSKLYKEELSGLMNEMTYYKTLERMCKNGELSKVSKGIYCIPCVSKYGIVPPSEKYIIDTFIKNETGTIIGYTLYNNLKLTTQISKKVHILSSNIDSTSKTVRNIVVNKVEIEYTNEVKDMISALDVLQNFKDIQDLNYSAFIDYSKEIAKKYNDEVFEKVIKKISYKKSTISFMKEVLTYYDISNNLEKYLSSLSSYKHPKMEEIYEIARVSK